MENSTSYIFRNESDDGTIKSDTTSIIIESDKSTKEIRIDTEPEFPEILDSVSDYFVEDIPFMTMEELDNKMKDRMLDEKTLIMMLE